MVIPKKVNNPIFDKMVDNALAGKCPMCAKPKDQILKDGFTDESSTQEYRITGFCQACQDEMYKEPVSCKGCSYLTIGQVSDELGRAPVMCLKFNTQGRALPEDDLYPSELEQGCWHQQEGGANDMSSLQ